MPPLSEAGSPLPGRGRLFHLIHPPSGRTIATVRRAEGVWSKGRGVLGRAALPPGQGLWLPGVASVHTLFVRFPLDLLFLDEALATVTVSLGVPPGRWLVRARGARHTVELGAGTLAGLDAQEGLFWVLRLANG